jgi:hypothetical protein
MNGFKKNDLEIFVEASFEACYTIEAFI